MAMQIANSYDHVATDEKIIIIVSFLFVGIPVLLVRRHAVTKKYNDMY